MRQEEIEEPFEDPLLDGEAVKKSAFLVFFQVTPKQFRARFFTGFVSGLYKNPYQDFFN